MLQSIQVPTASRKPPRDTLSIPYLRSLIMNFLILLSLFPIATTHPNSPYKPRFWTLTPTNTTQQFRGLSPVSSKIVWVSGTNGTVLRTLNSGATWKNVSPTFLSPENASNFQFRDIQAWSAKDAVVLSIGEAKLSRIYKTNKGGRKWERAFLNEDPAAFYDCMAFSPQNPRHGVALSDPVAGKFRLLETWNSGRHWSVVDTTGMPPALDGEAGFAASGTCIEAAAGRWYIATGGVDPGRIFYTSERDGRVDGKWEVTDSQILGGEAAGVFSVRFRGAHHGIAVGGNYSDPTGTSNTAAWSNDGGVRWHKADSFPGGYRSGVSWVPGKKDVAVAVGTSGSDITLDSGRNWKGIGNGTFDAVECLKTGCWASGSQGRVGWLDLTGL
jgi:photosystem II stability/assembly factor-like uncharacterized protein